MPTDIVGSREPEFASDVKISNVGYGQNGYNGPSSLTPAQARKVSKTYASIATATPDIKADASNVQARKISAKPIKAHPGTKGPSTGAKVPTTLLSRSVPPSVQPAKRGNAKR